jgi:predicted adenine nucleotide alpha hydrolase (AANH) superfamily ATPase
MKTNYSQITEKIISETASSGKKAKLLLQVCCAPCSSYVIEYLSEVFDITLFYYNPNISPESEYKLRLSELHRFVEEFPPAKDVKFLDAEYDPETFLKMSKGMENLPEGGERCKKCYYLRLEKTAQKAKDESYDYFSTTLSISPYKNAEWLNSIGGELSEKYSVKYLFSDFKKKNGYKRSIELSAQYGLYRQDWCGCAFSKRDAEIHRLEKNKE